MRYVLIVAGGSGKRLWPLSRQDMPKQLLKVVNGKSLLRIAYERLAGIVPPEAVLVCTGADYASVVRAELPEVDPANILGEPEGRDSLNAVAWPAAVLAARDPDAVIAVVTADQIMHPVSVFQQALEEGFALAEERPDVLVTFGVVPTSPHTGYGYLHRGAALPGHPDICSVVEFKEKPDLETAAEYVASGEYWWNSGMFVWQASTVLNVLDALLPESAARLRDVAAVWDTPEREATLAGIYPNLRKISVDYAVMEPASQGKVDADVVVVPMPVHWLDVGSWAALADTYTADANGNRTDSVTLSCLLDSHDNIIVTDDPDHLVAAVGLRSHIIVHTQDVTMVCPLSDGERVKDLVAQVQSDHSSYI